MFDSRSEVVVLSNTLRSSCCDDHDATEPSTELQSYIEDCEVCCNPIEVTSVDADGDIQRGSPVKGSIPASEAPLRLPT